MTRQVKSHIALISAGLIFGANYVIAKGMMPDHFLPKQIIFLRILGALILFTLLSFFVKETKRIERKDLMIIAISSLFGIAVNQMMFFIGLNLTTPINASIIHASSPMLVILFSMFLLGEKAHFLKIVGIIFGATGAVFLILGGNRISVSPENYLGNWLILINIAAYSLYLVMIKPIMNKYQPVQVMKWVFFFGLIYVSPFTISSFADFSASEIPANMWLSLIYVIAAVTFLAYLLTIYGLKHLNATVVGYYIYLQPVIAAIIAWYMFGEKITYVKIISTVFIFIGVFLVSSKPLKLYKRDS